MKPLSYTKSLLLLMLFLFFFEGSVAVVGFQQSYWGDESHFVHTVRQFGDKISFETLKHYNEMSTPLPFIAYALWGRMLNFDLNTLRILSLIIAFLTYLSFHYLLFQLLQNKWAALAGSFFLIIHPYMIGFSVFVFTDMIPIFASIMGLIAIQRRNTFIFTLASLIGLLSRQYFIFFVATCFLFFLINLWFKREYQYIKMLMGSALSGLALLGLFVFWKGFSPQNELNDIYLGEAFRFHPNYFNLYIILFFIYLMPLIVWRWKYFYSNKTIMIISALMSGFYFLFPVEVCKAALHENLHTVGYFHKLLRIIVPIHFEHVVFYAAFLLGIPIMLSVFKDGYDRLRLKQFDLIFLLDLTVILFLLIMSFSYLIWEKYFMPLVPLTILQILLVHQEPQRF